MTIEVNRIILHHQQGAVMIKGEMTGIDRAARGTGQKKDNDEIEANQGIISEAQLAADIHHIVTDIQGQRLAGHRREEIKTKNLVNAANHENHQPKGRDCWKSGVGITAKLQRKYQKSWRNSPPMLNKLHGFDRRQPMFSTNALKTTLLKHRHDLKAFASCLKKNY